MAIEQHGKGYGAFETTDRFWDCECIDGNVHRFDVPTCPKCHAARDESPDSRVNEILALYPSLRREQL